MAKKRRRRQISKAKKVKEAPSSRDEAILRRRLMERDLRATKQVVEQRKFESVDELNAFLQERASSGELPDWVPQTPLDKAQDLIYQAWETPSRKWRVQLAYQALKVSPDCADAYVLLAEETARSTKEALKLYEAGVEAGERALGTKVFAQEVGHFWGVVETRPYMRARAGLAQCLCALGKHHEAVNHYQAMLRLNPHDNQGIRYLLAACLLIDIGNIDALWELLQEYEGEISAAWLYTWALATFLDQGDSRESRKCLKKALKQNPHVVLYLLGRQSLPKKLPQYMGFGDQDEAIIYVAEFGQAWRKTEGALDWLESVWLEKQRKSVKAPEIPQAFIKAFEEEDSPKSPRENLLKEDKELTKLMRQFSRQRIYDMWQQVKEGETLDDPNEALLGKLMKEHTEYYPYWDKTGKLADKGNLVKDKKGANPFLHLFFEAALENQLQTGEIPEVRQVLWFLVEKGMEKHEARHTILNVFIEEVWYVLREERKFDVEAYRRKLRELMK